MKNSPGLLHRIPFYPLFLGLYPILFFWLVNYFGVPTYVVWFPLLLSIGLAVAIYLLCGLVIRNLRKAGAVAGIFLLMFFFAGRVYELKVFDTSIVDNPYAIALWVFFLCFEVWGVLRYRSNLYTLTWVLNLVVGFLLVLTIGQLLAASWTNRQNIVMSPTPSHTDISGKNLVQPANADAPDVFYIVLDGYNRQDLLQKDIGLDNRPFISQLEQLGFVVPNCTQSNYDVTVLSVASALNMNYLDNLGFSNSTLAKSEYSIDMSSPGLNAAIRSNLVMNQFKDMGYQIITMQEPIPFLNFPDSDIIFDHIADDQEKIETITFQFVFWQTTALRSLQLQAAKSPEMFKELPGWIYRIINPYYLLKQKYQQDLYQLEQLENVAQLHGKKFVYAHLLITHQEFAFTANGELRTFADWSMAVYGDQISYANQRILMIIKKLIDQSSAPPIIILQGDHGYGNGDKGEKEFKILNAYFLPGSAKEQIYPNITPVNTFRMILNEYFHRNYPLLPDQSIWITPLFPSGYELQSGSCIS